MASWLAAHSYETRYKPVPIHEHLVYDGKVFPVASTRSLVRSAEQLHGTTASQSSPAPSRKIDLSEHKEFRDPVLNAVLALAYETAIRGYGVLVFAGSRNGCESDARWLSRIMPSPEMLDPLLLDRRMDLLSELRSLNTGVDPVLEETVLSGVAFHRELLVRMLSGMNGLTEELLADVRIVSVIKLVRNTDCTGRFDHRGERPGSSRIRRRDLAHLRGNLQPRGWHQPVSIDEIQRPCQPLLKYVLQACSSSHSPQRPYGARLRWAISAPPNARQSRASGQSSCRRDLSLLP